MKTFQVWNRAQDYDECDALLEEFKNEQDAIKFRDDVLATDSDLYPVLEIFPCEVQPDPLTVTVSHSVYLFVKGTYPKDMLRPGLMIHSDVRWDGHVFNERDVEVELIDGAGASPYTYRIKGSDKQAIEREWKRLYSLEWDEEYKEA